jgi:Right handed beta helix region
MNLCLFPIALVLASCSGCSSADSVARYSGGKQMADFKVSTATALTKALAQAKSGDRILLASGNYGAVSIKNLSFVADVTIMSANAAKPAVIDSLTVRGSSHILFQGLEIGHALTANEPAFTTFGDVSGSKNIGFDSVYFHGSLDSNATNDGNGLKVTGSSSISIKNSRFEQVGRGVLFSSTTDISLTGSTFIGIRSDGADFGDVQRVLIDRNVFRDFDLVSGDHPDAIQFWTKGTTRASTDIVISNNQILQGNGSGMQGIFLTDQVGTLPFANVSIVNNLGYVSEMYNGIMVSNGKNVTVAGNTILSPGNDSKKFWIRLENITGGVLKDNVTDIFVGTGNTGIVTSGNKFAIADKTFATKIKGLNSGAAATVASLIVSGVGYSSVRAGATITGAPGTNAAATATATAAIDPVQTSTAFSVATFLPAGLADTSTTSVASVAPVAPAVAVNAPAPSLFSASDFLAASAPISVATTLSPLATAPIAASSLLTVSQMRAAANFAIGIHM